MRTSRAPVARVVTDDLCADGGASDTDARVRSLLHNRSQRVHVRGAALAVDSAFAGHAPADKDAMQPGGQSAAISMVHGAWSGNPYARAALASLAPFSDIAAAAQLAACPASAGADAAAGAVHSACGVSSWAPERISTLASTWLPWVQGQATEAREVIQGDASEVAAAYASIANPPEHGCGGANGPVSIFARGVAPITSEHGRLTAGMMNSLPGPVQPLHLDFGTSVHAAANAAAAGDTGLARLASLGQQHAQDAARNASWGLEPGTVVMGHVPNSAYTPRALVTNAPPETRRGMQLETFVARSMPYAWGRWTQTVPEWARTQLVVSPSGKEVLMGHPLLPTASAIMPNSGGVGPVLATLVTPFAGGALSTVYGPPFEGQYHMYAELAPQALPTGQVPVPQTGLQVRSIPAPATFTTMRAQ